VRAMTVTTRLWKVTTTPGSLFTLDTMRLTPGWWSQRIS
jgi:hypothetical protein